MTDPLKHMSVTTIPFMEAVAETATHRADWWHFECELCGWQSFGGHFGVCEDEAVEHLEEMHARQYAKALRARD